jgi:hypothetical protein
MHVPLRPLAGLRVRNSASASAHALSLLLPIMLLILERRLLTLRINPGLRFGKGLLTKRRIQRSMWSGGKHQTKSRHCKRCYPPATVSKAVSAGFRSKWVEVCSGGVCKVHRIGSRVHLKVHTTTTNYSGGGFGRNQLDEANRMSERFLKARTHSDTFSARTGCTPQDTQYLGAPKPDR